ncbi:MAG: hypothetical protein ABJN80_08690, partial [Luteolibacter sp.]
HTGKAQTKAPPAKLLQPGDARRVVAQEAFKTDLFPKMVNAAKAVAERASSKPTDAAKALATETISKQIARLRDLAARNPAVSDQEIKTLEHTLTETTEALSNSRVRLDSLRLILCR